jgi:uncharacterized protein YceK
MSARSHRVIASVLVMLVCLALGGCGAVKAITADKPFPAIAAGTLNDDQTKLLALLRQAYADEPAGTTFSQGVDEPWCADFVSWVYHQIGLPFDNPNSGSWRIPGVATLEDYFRSAGTFHAPDATFTPRLGDVVIYDPSSTVWGQHTNIVLSLVDDQLTTIGGNQTGGISVATHPLVEPGQDIRGFGRRIPG